MAKINFIGHSRLFLTISGAIVVAAVVCTLVFGLNPGIDFTGGSLLNVRFDSAVAQEDVHSAVAEIGYDPLVQTASDGSLFVRVRPVSEEEHQAILTGLRERFGEVEELRFNSVGPVVGEELRRSAIIAIVLVLLLIGLYIAWAFRKVSAPVASWKYGVITLLTAFHDVVIPVGVFSLLGHFYGFQADTAFVAAILTILGYSINDTIVVFDRTRENLYRHRFDDQPFSGVVNQSVNETLARSINTTLAVLLPLLAIIIFGGESTRPFAITLLVGIFAGAYSSIFIASPLLVMSERWGKGK